MRNELWPLSELLRRLHEALARLPAPRDPRVRRRPDVRVFRYYVARGLVEGPSAMRGRRGLYGRRHLLQLLAIRHLQAQGRTLAQIQSRLVDLGDQELEQLIATTPRREPRPRPSTEFPQEIELQLAPGIRLQVEDLERCSAGERRRLRRLATPLLRRLASLRARGEEEKER